MHVYCSEWIHYSIVIEKSENDVRITKAVP